MKFLLDENIFPLLIEKVKEHYPGSVDIYDIGYEGRSDFDIYEFLKQHDYILVTFDLDFSDIRKFPPEFVEGIILLRFKNKKIQEVLTDTLKYISKLKELNSKNSLFVFQNSGIRVRQRLKKVK